MKLGQGRYRSLRNAAAAAASACLLLVAAPGAHAAALVATNAGQVPSDWIAAHTEGGCVTNPFAPACGGPGTPIRVAYFPSAKQVAAVSQGTATSTRDETVTGPGIELDVVTAVGPPPARAGVANHGGSRAAAAQAASRCRLRTYAPELSFTARWNVEGDATLDDCTWDSIEATACVDLYKRRVPKAYACDPAFGAPPVSVAQAFYRCRRIKQRVRYRDVGTSFIENSEGQAAFGSNSVRGKLRCR